MLLPPSVSGMPRYRDSDSSRSVHLDTGGFVRSSEDSEYYLRQKDSGGGARLTESSWSAVG